MTSNDGGNTAASIALLLLDVCSAKRSLASLQQAVSTFQECHERATADLADLHAGRDAVRASAAALGCSRADADAAQDDSAAQLATLHAENLQLKALLKREMVARQQLAAQHTALLAALHGRGFLPQQPQGRDAGGQPGEQRHNTARSANNSSAELHIALSGGIQPRSVASSDSGGCDAWPPGVPVPPQHASPPPVLGAYMAADLPQRASLTGCAASAYFPSAESIHSMSGSARSSPSSAMHTPLAQTHLAPQEQGQQWQHQERLEQEQVQHQGQLECADLGLPLPPPQQQQQQQRQQEPRPEFKQKHVVQEFHQQHQNSSNQQQPGSSPYDSTWAAAVAQMRSPPGSLQQPSNVFYAAKVTPKLARRPDDSTPLGLQQLTAQLRHLQQELAAHGSFGSEHARADDIAAGRGVTAATAPRTSASAPTSTPHAASGLQAQLEQRMADVQQHLHSMCTSSPLHDGLAAASGSREPHRLGVGAIPGSIGPPPPRSSMTSAARNTTHASPSTGHADNSSESGSWATVDGDGTGASSSDGSGTSAVTPQRHAWPPGMASAVVAERDVVEEDVSPLAARLADWGTHGCESWVSQTGRM